MGLCFWLWAQNESDEHPLLRIDQGISIQQDSSFLLNLRFRMQNRFGYLSQLDDTTAPGYDIRVRRLRLRLDGFALSPKLSYYIQLSFAAGDQDQIEGFALNIVRDAMVYYEPTPSLYIGLGQGKLPGNRQRVISSGNLQMPERSYANQFYTLDRDVSLPTFQGQSGHYRRRRTHLWLFKYSPGLYPAYRILTLRKLQKYGRLQRGRLGV
ncbi:MAG: porin [Bacteroidia bacterium]|nr:porin [Bacteroidia bacterium]